MADVNGTRDLVAAWGRLDEATRAVDGAEQAVLRDASPGEAGEAALARCVCAQRDAINAIAEILWLQLREIEGLRAEVAA